jgi:hypothetical protein
MLISGSAQEALAKGRLMLSMGSPTPKEQDQRNHEHEHGVVEATLNEKCEPGDEEDRTGEIHQPKENPVEVRHSRESRRSKAADQARQIETNPQFSLRSGFPFGR